MQLREFGGLTGPFVLPAHGGAATHVMLLLHLLKQSHRIGPFIGALLACTVAGTACVINLAACDAGASPGAISWP